MKKKRAILLSLVVLACSEFYVCAEHQDVPQFAHEELKVIFNMLQNPQMLQATLRKILPNMPFASMGHNELDEIIKQDPSGVYAGYCCVGIDSNAKTKDQVLEALLRCSLQVKREMVFTYFVHSIGKISFINEAGGGMLQHPQQVTNQQPKKIGSYVVLPVAMAEELLRDSRLMLEMCTVTLKENVLLFASDSATEEKLKVLHTNYTTQFSSLEKAIARARQSSGKAIFCDDTITEEGIVSSYMSEATKTAVQEAFDRRIMEHVVSKLPEEQRRAVLNNGRTVLEILQPTLLDKDKLKEKASKKFNKILGMSEYIIVRDKTLKSIQKIPSEYAAVISAQHAK